MKLRQITQVQFQRNTKKKIDYSAYHVFVSESKIHLGVNIIFNLKNLPKDAILVGYGNNVSKSVLERIVTEYQERLKTKLSYEIPTDVSDSDSD